MDGLLFSLASSLWLGVLTSISPCPMATNITAISFIGRKVNRPGYVLLTGLLYTLGRSLAYAVLGLLIVNSLLSMPVISSWFQKYMPRLLGPILIITGMILLDLLTIKTKGSGLGSWCQKNVEKFGLGGAFLLGVIFALSFCPVSAALFFGSLIPLSIKQSSSFLLPLVYGVGTALPVFAFAIVIALAANSVSRVFDKVTQFEKWSRRITGGVFLAVGIYFTVAYTIGLKG